MVGAPPHVRFRLDTFRFDSWAKAGVFQNLMDALIAEAAARGQADLELVSVASTIVRRITNRQVWPWLRTGPTPPGPTGPTYAGATSPR